MRAYKKIILAVAASFFLSQPVLAQVILNEIMYDLPGADTGREWVEIVNIGSEAVTVATTTWKFFEADTNHSLSLFQGGLSIAAGGFAVIADDPNKFLLDWPGFSGTIFGSSFSLSNTGEIIALKTSSTTIADQVTYTSSTGAAGDGNSLQKVSGIWKALLPTPGLTNSNGSGNSATSSNQTENPSPSATMTAEANSSADSSASVNSSNNSNWPVDQQIFSRIIGPSTAIAGADIVLQGEAIGLDKKPIANPRYLWNFGDGATKEGENVMHAYNFPGDYVVILDVSGGKFSATNRFRIKIVAADIVVSGIVSGYLGKVELVNNSNQELDLSWWRLKSGNQFFTLPKNTKIVARGKLPLSSSVTGLNVNPLDVALLYPNGLIAYQSETVLTSSPAVVSAPTPSAATMSKVKSEPLKTSLIASSQKTSRSIVIVESAVPSPTSSQIATVAAVFDAPNGDGKDNISQPTVIINQSQPTSQPSRFVYFLVSIIIIGLGIAFLPKPSGLKSLAEEFTIIED